MNWEEAKQQVAEKHEFLNFENLRVCHARARSTKTMDKYYREAAELMANNNRVEPMSNPMDHAKSLSNQPLLHPAEGDIEEACQLIWMETQTECFIEGAKWAIEWYKSKL